MSEPKITIERPDASGEIQIIKYDEIVISHTNHDSDGWAGMGAVEDVIRTLANLLDIKVVEL